MDILRKLWAPSTLIAGMMAALAVLLGPAALAQVTNHINTRESRYMRDFPEHLLSTEPPWSAPLYQGTEVTVPGLENVPDIHGDINNPQLVIFFAGNQYMLVNQLMRKFMEAYPKYKRVVAFTFPPGRLITAIDRGNGILLGNMHITLKPDILTAGHGSIAALQRRRHWFSKIEVYARNRLAIMVYKGNPHDVTGLQSLARPRLKVCMPNPEWEGIAKHAIIPALKLAGGQELVDEIYKQKVRYGTTFLTHIHHRQTPIRIMRHQCAAGVVWYTEAYFHADIAKHPISIVNLTPQHNKVVAYTAAILRSAPHRQAAEAFMRFLLGAQAQALYRHYGFMPPR